MFSSSHAISRIIKFDDDSVCRKHTNLNNKQKSIERKNVFQQKEMGYCNLDILYLDSLWRQPPHCPEDQVANYKPRKIKIN
jgi:hypothetical protein